MIKEIFEGTKISIHKFDNIKYFSGKEEFQRIIDFTFQSNEIKNSSAIERYGKALTTVGHIQKYDPTKILDLKNNELGKWIYKSIAESAKLLNIEGVKEFDNFSFSRAWMNRMYKDSHGGAHSHKGAYCDMVCIFYYEAPKGCSELIFVNDPSAVNGQKPYYEFPEDKRYHLTPEPGLLVCHDKEIPHAVGVHNSNEPRTVFVFEPFFKLKSIQNFGGYSPP